MSNTQMPRMLRDHLEQLGSRIINNHIENLTDEYDMLEFLLKKARAQLAIEGKSTRKAPAIELVAPTKYA